MLTKSDRENVVRDLATKGYRMMEIVYCLASEYGTKVSQHKVRRDLDRMGLSLQSDGEESYLPTPSQIAEEAARIRSENARNGHKLTAVDMAWQMMPSHHSKHRVSLESRNPRVRRFIA